MRVLVLSWDAGGPGGPSVRAAGLATALADGGASVRVVTRLAEGGRPAVLRGCEVHAVPDTAPVLPPGLASDELHALAFASPALAVATRRLRDRSVDLTFADGVGPRDVVGRLGREVGLVAVDVADLLGPAPAARAAHGGAPHDPPVAPTAVRAVATNLPAAIPTVPTVEAADHLAALGVAAVAVPGCAPSRPRRPGPPPPKGPVRLVAAPGEAHRAVARRVRAVLRAAGTPRVVTGSDRDRPAVCLVLDATATDDVLRAAARGVPVVTVPGRSAAAARALGCGVVAPGERGAVAACAALLAEPGAAATLGATGVDGSARAAARAAEVLRGLVADGSGPADRVRPVLRAVR